MVTLTILENSLKKKIQPFSKEPRGKRLRCETCKTRRKPSYFSRESLDLLRRPSNQCSGSVFLCYPFLSLVVLCRLFNTKHFHSSSPSSWMWWLSGCECVVFVVILCVHTTPLYEVLCVHFSILYEALFSASRTDIKEYIKVATW